MVPVSQMAGAGQRAAHVCHVSRDVSTPWPTRPCGETSGIYQKGIRRVHFVLHTIQSHSAGLSLRVRGVYIAWRGGGLTRPRDPDHGAAAAAATNGRQPRARARSGGGEGWKER